jgi:hypothetical protein
MSVVTHTVQTSWDSSDAPEKEGHLIYEKTGPLIYEKTGDGRQKWSSALMGSDHAADFDISYEIEKNINMQVRCQIEQNHHSRSDK